MNELWKPINGYEGFYEISNKGRVRSLDRKVLSKNNSYAIKKGKYLALINLKKGYIGCRLSKNGQVKNFQVHRLVSQAFLENPNNYPCVNHKDENVKNNCVDNLEWCSFDYNNKYGNRTNKAIKTNKMNNKLGKVVIQYSIDGKYIAEFKSCHDVQDKLGFWHTTISKCALGKLKTAYGYIWKYKD